MAAMAANGLGLTLFAGEGRSRMELTASVLCSGHSECAAVFDSCHNGVVVIDTSGVVTIYNRAARRIFNDGNRPVVGEHFRDVRPETWPDLKRAR
jgi:sensor histidine kinase regulating citrate/malate metabolism